MAESEFSWLKIASFFGAVLLVLVAIVTVASGIQLIVDDKATNGVFTIISGVISGYCAYLVYKNYQKKSLANR